MPASVMRNATARRPISRYAPVLLLGAALVGIGGEAEAVSHGDCQIHGARPYAHRHVEPNDTTVTCERPAITGRAAVTARCVAEGFSGGRQVLGTRVSSEVPIPPRAPAALQADALNQACAEAMAGCQAAASGLGRPVDCQRVDQNFSQ